MHVLTDLLLPLTLIKLLAPGAWLDAYTALGLLYGMLMVLVVMAFRGYVQYPTHTIARKTRLVYRSWSISTIVLFATLLLLPPDLPIETRLVVIWILIIGMVKPEWAPPIPAAERAETAGWKLVRRVFVALIPPAFLMVAVLGSIFAGIASPTEAAALGDAPDPEEISERVDRVRTPTLVSHGLLDMQHLTSTSGVAMTT